MEEQKNQMKTTNQMVKWHKPTGWAWLNKKNLQQKELTEITRAVHLSIREMYGIRIKTTNLQLRLLNGWLFLIQNIQRDIHVAL